MNKEGKVRIKINELLEEGQLASLRELQSAILGMNCLHCCRPCWIGRLRESCDGGEKPSTNKATNSRMDGAGFVHS